MAIGHPFDKKVDASIFRKPAERTPRNPDTAEAHTRRHHSNGSPFRLVRDCVMSAFGRHGVRDGSVTETVRQGGAASVAAVPDDGPTSAPQGDRARTRSGALR
ncbi:hypothetical protein KNE206_38710 [Kitasatospora sp. NE20-6]